MDYDKNNQIYNMKIKTRFLLFLLIATSVLLTACSTFSRGDYYTFNFDLFDDDQNAEILDYWYGPDESGQALERMSERSLKAKETRRRWATSGFRPKGDSLYVKWRDISTGIVYEERANLRGRLPQDMSDCILTFMIYGPKLHVYLVTKQYRPLGEKAIGPSKYGTYKVILIN